ncbi:MAG: PPOX class F420-dependent oxidoreductase [Actinomycetota bacterium]
MAIADEKYVAFTTYTKAGAPKTSPVWIAGLGDGDGKVGFTTSEHSWKVKRLRNDPRVQLQPSDARGNVTPGSEAVSGTAVVHTGADAEAIRNLIKKKYGIQFTLIGLGGKIAGLLGRRNTSSNASIEITLDA